MKTYLVKDDQGFEISVTARNEKSAVRKAEATLQGAGLVKPRCIDITDEYEDEDEDENTFAYLKTVCK